MKRALRAIFRPTNRGVRILVGILLVTLLAMQMTQSFANRNSGEQVVVTGEDFTLTTDSPDRIKTLLQLAETDHVALLKFCEQKNRQRIADSYTCTFVKQERLRGNLSKEQEIKVKFRGQPFSVAMEWITNKPMGDALLFVDGQYKDDQGRSQMMVRPTSSFLQTLTGGHVLRLPDGPDAMKNTLRPCTMFGFANSLQSLIEVYEQGRAKNECTELFGDTDKATGKEIKFTEVDGRKCLVLVRYLPNTPEYPAYKTIVCIDLEYLLPVRLVGYDDQNKLVCNYEFRNVDFSRSLEDSDFTPVANGIRTK